LKFDGLFLEYVRHQVAASKPLNQKLAASPDYVYLNYLLLISDFRLMGNSVLHFEESKLMSLIFSKKTNLMLFICFFTVNQEHQIN
jgi:hypothetical protein